MRLYLLIKVKKELFKSNLILGFSSPLNGRTVSKLEQTTVFTVFIVYLLSLFVLCFYRAAVRALLPCLSCSCIDMLYGLFILSEINDDDDKPKLKVKMQSVSDDDVQKKTS